MAAGDFRVQLTSPTEFAKEKVQALQEYALLVGQSLANLFRRPLYVTDMVQQADLIGVGSLAHRDSNRRVHRRRAGSQ